MTDLALCLPHFPLNSFPLLSLSIFAMPQSGIWTRSSSRKRGIVDGDWLEYSRARRCSLSGDFESSIFFPLRNEPFNVRFNTRESQISRLTRGALSDTPISVTSSDNSSSTCHIRDTGRTALIGGYMEANRVQCHNIKRTSTDLTGTKSVISIRKSAPPISPLGVNTLDRVMNLLAFPLNIR